MNLNDATERHSEGNVPMSLLVGLEDSSPYRDLNDIPLQ